MNKKQMELIKGLKLDFIVPNDLSLLPVDDLNILSDAISDHFQLHGIDAGNEVNEIGLVCEIIMDIIGDL